jgi:riboflavin kinase/FMN adenylyltransferase
MEIIHFQDKPVKPIFKNIVIGIGKFDGFHLGHQKIVQTILDIARNKNIIPAVFTFKNFPCEFYLYPWDEKMNFFENAGIQLCIWSEFEEIKIWEPDKFLEFLKNFYKVSEIVVGKDFKFGKHRKADGQFLLSWGRKNNMGITLVSHVIMHNKPISSSIIRSLIKEGSVHTVYEMTGRYFSISGKVIKGIGLGRKLGVPTANVYLTDNIPFSEGVYVALTEYKNELLRSIAYYGTAPTVSINQKRFEVHIFDFLKDIYDETLKVYLIKKIRPEKIFSSTDSLKKQIEKDIHTARNYPIITSGIW